MPMWRAVRLSRIELSILRSLSRFGALATVVAADS
jgi:hypothetical protein